MYNFNRIHRYWTEGPAEEQTHVIIKRNCYDCHKCDNCELMNKAERCIKTIKKLANKFIARKQSMVSDETYIMYKDEDNVIYLDKKAADKFKRDVMRAIREAYEWETYK